MKNIITLLFSVLTIGIASAQKDTAFIYTFGGENDEQGRDIEMTLDSGFIMVGATSSFGAGNSDIYMVKVDSNINFEWSAAIGHEFTEFGHAVKQTADSGYVICGYTNSIGNGNYDAYLVRTDKKGKLLWEKTFGGFDWDFAYDLEITADGGFLIVGETHSIGNGNADAYLIKTDKDGNLEWEKNMGGSGKDIAHALIATADGNFAFCGENASKNPENKGDAWLVKFDGDGDTLFDRTAKTSELTVSYDLAQDTNNLFYCIGYTTAVNPVIEDVEIISYSQFGEFRWSSFQGGVNLGAANKNDRGYAIVADEQDNLFISGTSESSGNGAKGMYFGQVHSGSRLNIGAPTFGGVQNEEGYSVIKLKNKIISFGESESYGTAYTDFYAVVIEDDTITQEYVIIESSKSDSMKAVPNSILEANFNKPNFKNPLLQGELASCNKFEIIKVVNIKGNEVSFTKMNGRFAIHEAGLHFIFYQENSELKHSKILILHDF